MKRRRFLLTTGLGCCSALTGCLGGVVSNESPDPPESCEPAFQELALPDEGILNENDIDEYIKRVEEHRFLDQTQHPDYTTISLSVNAVSSHGEGFIVDIIGNGSSKTPDYTVAVSLRRTTPENVTVESADSDPFSAVKSLQETIDTAKERLSGKHCRGRAGADVSSSELDQLKTAFEGMESDEDDWYYLEGDACYISVNFDESRVIVELVEEAPGGVSVEPVGAERFDMKLLQDAIDEALDMSDDNRNRASSRLSETEYDQLKAAFEDMEPDDDGFYYLQHNEWYAAVRLQKGEVIGDFVPWVARYYVDAEQVRVTTDETDAFYGTVIDDEDIEELNLDNPAKSRVIIC